MPIKVQPCVFLIELSKRAVIRHYYLKSFVIWGSSGLLGAHGRIRRVGFWYSRAASHVVKCGRADDRPNLAMLAIDIGSMIDRGLDALAGSATASTTAKTAEATDQTTGRYLLEIDRSNDQSSDRSNFAVDRFYYSAHCTSIAGMNFF